MKNVLIGLKISIAAILAIVIANLLKLDYSVSAGIVAILSIASTKRETIKTVVERLLAFIIAIVIAFICFNLVGFNFIAFYIYLVLYLVICKYKNWGSAMAVNSVLVSHFLLFKEISLTTISNELLLFVIGALCGILVNLHLKANNNYMKEMYVEINTQIKKILCRMSERICNKDIEDYNGSCFTLIQETIKITKDKANENIQNSFTNKSNDLDYISLIEQEVHILYNIYKKINNLEVNLITTKCISDFILELATIYDNELLIDDVAKKYNDLKLEIKEMILPKTRVEFENRAKLYIVLEYINELLILKKEFINKK